MADFTEVWHEVCKKAWKDPDFKRRLRARPNEVLKEHGYSAPEGFNFVVMENEPFRMFLVLPAKPSAVKKVAPAGDTTITQYNASIV
jgi:hypothetical protein